MKEKVDELREQLKLVQQTVNQLNREGVSITLTIGSQQKTVDILSKQADIDCFEIVVKEATINQEL